MKLKAKGSGKMIISPSILSVYQTKLDESIKALENVGCELLHVDVMDNLFVPNYTFDHEFVSKLHKKTNIILDTHLMILNPEEEVEKYILAGSKYVTFHYEATRNPLELIRKIKSLGAKAGISIKPNTKVEVLDQLLPELDLILVMSVEPGFGGQSFMENSLEKIAYLKNERMKKELSFLIEVDGGINDKTGKLCKEAGCDIIVVGSYLMNKEDVEATFKKLKEL